MSQLTLVDLGILREESIDRGTQKCIEQATYSIHILKTWPEYYKAITHSDPKKRKTVEIRKDDRNFNIGDVLILKEYELDKGYTGRVSGFLVTHCLRGEPWVPEGYVAMSIRKLQKKDNDVISHLSYSFLS